MTTVLTYDRTFDGLLSTIFYSFEYKLFDVKIEPQDISSLSLFGETIAVATDLEKSQRVWSHLKRQLSNKGLRDFYKAFLSELPGIENTLLSVTKKVIATTQKVDQDYSDNDFLKVAQVAKKVDREKHRMDAFVRFRLSKDGIYFATVEPDFNVLPLNLKHFTSRYADQKWLIYDLKRGYGIYYDLNSSTYVQLALEEDINNSSKASVYFTEEELEFQTLWQSYFKHTNITSRKNTRLHLQHVPKRYWKHLSEKHFNLND